MEILLSKNAGFCPGVRRAADAVKRLISERRENGLIFTIGPLIHNSSYISSLEAEGVYSVDISNVASIIDSNPDKDITFVIRTHGISLGDGEYLRALEKENPRVKIVDMTCPSVKRIHDIAIKETNENSFFLLYGSKTHPESVATISYAKGTSAIISSEEELLNTDFQGKTPILCAQTTGNFLQFIQKN